MASPAAPVLSAQDNAADAEPASLFVSDKRPRFEMVGRFTYYYPPGPDQEAPPPDTNAPATWRLKDGKPLKLEFNSWEWKLAELPDGKERWTVVVGFYDRKASTFRKIPGADFSTQETPRLLRLLWGQFNEHLKWSRERHARQEADTKEAANWHDRIANYTGEELRKPGEKALPSLRSASMQKAPDLRSFQGWGLNSVQGIPRKVGIIRILDWAVTETPEGFFGPGRGIPVRIRLGDGTEETVPAACIRLDAHFTPFLLSLWKDWATIRLKEAGTPAAALKIKALAASLPDYWEDTIREREDELENANRDKAGFGGKQAGVAEFLKGTGIYRFGHRLHIPGTPPAGFQPIEAAAPDRATIPVLDQGPLGTRASDCLPSSIATFFLWWDEQKWLPLQQKGDLNKRADWLHSQLAREMRTQNNRGTQWTHVSAGLTDFSRRFLGDRYAFVINYDYDYTPANIARCVQGGHATVLTLTTWNGPRESGGHAVAVLSATEAGEITIATWGLKLTGKWKAVNLPKAQKKSRAGDNPLPRYELELTGLTDSDRKELRSTRFILDASNFDGIAVITPFTRNAAVVR